ncbi:low-density lipoprotein receptor-like protein [Leptotrombidium deliense]|uniref:Low-density lipoprotein receptor-like protein n=1 Tax=Leptotrombidium deliense TaxID=299467 RepID=A0A443S4Q9_9ACAR|nr:low-density lipoprotein receptor-like protein [Leptotrombidium deliense]
MNVCSQSETTSQSSRVECSADVDAFRCLKDNFCIKSEAVCDLKKDCSDGSDESDLCKIDECELSKHNCTKDQLCVDRKIGFECDCFDGFTLNLDTKKCEDVDECSEKNDPCQGRKCTNKVGEFQCDCENGLFTSTIPCKDANKRYLLYVTDDNVKVSKVSIFNEPLHEWQSKTVLKSSSPKTVDYNFKTNSIAWSEYNATDKSNTIFIAKLDDSLKADLNNVEKLIWNLAGYVNDIAIDSIHGLIFILNSHFATIQVAVIDDPLMRKTLISDVFTDAISLSVKHSIIVWIQKKSRIVIVNEDGSNRRMVDGDNDEYPSSVAIDDQSEKIYWIDSKTESFYSCDFKGKNKKLLYAHDDDLHETIMDFLDNAIYWTSNLNVNPKLINKLRLDQIHEIDKDNITASIDNVLRFKSEIIDFKVIKKDMQISIYNRCLESKCSHICVPQSYECYVCVCPVDHVLSDDSFTCVVKTGSVKYLLTKSEPICLGKSLANVKFNN